ncbi:6,7-dimethyl-8-ribityllumazine synthase [Zhihengliuella salsuginis]|uniref:6,7-dimethyl-8-ribityllumazine synthase n=1 Tax=Zhihengliuella salsuginis TaxID=578222 RepID=A0ABQ3GJA2_9MICC|nr:6,7-dimethyl-8-ribityllumazine synthase [Zhihengliuella salsuginis]GHD06350.1 6,7-dimethyl-8-ribityllumazine synthase [Zhihengliuella salsuginis]
MTEQLNVAFIKAGWHGDIVGQSLTGFTEDMETSGVACAVDVVDVPGAFEMPLQAKRLAETGKYDAVVASALVVDGGIYRHDFVAQAVVDGLMRVQLDTGVPTFSVSLTPHHFQPTAEHEKFFFDHFVKKGAEAARAVRSVASLYRQS